MNDLLPQAVQSFSDAWIQAALGGATQAFVAFVLVVTRVSGLLVIGPVFGHPDFPLQMRVLLVMMISLLLTPTLLTADGQSVFKNLDANRDGQLVSEEIPNPWQEPALRMRAAAGKPADAPLTAAEFRLTLPFPSSLADLAWLVIAEFGLGLALGLGVMTVMSGLQLAGNLVDAQLGVSLGEVFNPELETPTSFSSDLLYLLGTVVLLGLGGHVMMISTLAETFRALPVGYAFVSPPALDLLRDLVNQSLALALQIAAPILATLSIVGLAMGYLGHTIPQVNVLIMGFPIRALAGLLVFVAALSGMGDRIAQTLPAVMDQLRLSLTGH